jgi:anti-sigma-K factor RskA
VSIDLHTLSGVYAIDALSPEEAAEFEQHLALCLACQDEVRELREAASRMGATEARTPSSHLKARVMAAADKTPQLPPKVRSIESARKPRWTPRLLSAAAAVILIVAAAVGVVQLQHNNDQGAMTASVSQVFKAPDKHTSTVNTANGKVVVATSKGLNEMAVDTADLKKLSDKQVYQLWTIKDGSATSAGVLDNIDAGKAMGMPQPGAQVAITIEPAGGSQQPTSEPIATVDPSSV